MAPETKIDLSDLETMLGDEGGTEGQALATIVLWSETCSPWQRDALRRLCVSEGLTETDVEELTKICRAKPQPTIL
jgi:hypothetical protein